MKKFKPYKIKTLYLHKVYMTSSEAERLYHEADEFPKRKPCGFYSIELSFEDWLQYHDIYIY